MRKVLLLSIVVLAVAGLSVFASDYPAATQPAKKLTKAPVLFEKDAQVLVNERGVNSGPPQLNSVLIDSGRNGYGYASSGPKSIDVTTDLFGSDWAGVVYRKFVPGDPATGIIGVAELDINAGFNHSNFTFWDYINNVTGTTIGGRYPSFQAAPDGPVPMWTQYDVAGTPTQARAMLSFDPWGWGAFGGGWILPVDWAKDSNPNIIHSLWLGCTDIYKDPSNLYHVGGVWEIDLNSGNYTFLHGWSNDLQSWTFESGALDWSALDYEMNSPRFAWGSNGFGAWVSTGHFIPGDTDFRLLVSTTNDYGATWSAVERYRFETLGIPEYIYASDSIYVPDPQGGPPILYEDSAYVGITYDFDLVVTPANEIHVGCTISWGPDAGNNSYYPNGLHMGLYDIHSADGGATWNSSRIWWNAGLLEGDTTGSWITTNEIDLGRDDQGNIYAAWVDRDRTVVNPTPYPHTNSTITNHFVQDVWASMSPDGGNSWSAQPVRVTNDTQNSSYGLRLATRTNWYPNDNGKTYLVYQIADLSRPLTPPIDIMADHVQWYYVGEAMNFPAPTSIEKNDNLVVKEFALHQNYPNPFNPTTNIRFDLDRRQAVNVTVYNNLGQQVAMLHNGLLDAGSYHLTWNASDQPTGIYFLRLTTPNHREVRKMMLVK